MEQIQCVMVEIQSETDLMRFTSVHFAFPSGLKGTQQAAKWSNESKYVKPKKTIEIQPVRPTEVCVKV